MNSSIWGEYKAEDQAVHFFELGDLYLWIEFREGEVWIAHSYKDQVELQSEAKTAPAEVEWARWATKDNVQTVRLIPVFPDKPLMVKSEYPLRLGAGTKIQIYTRIPVWVRIYLPTNNYILTEIPTKKLSRTWFGTPLEGELCLYSTTKARRSLSKVEAKSFIVNCPIIISNKAEEDLNFDKFCYRVERLSIYRHENELWADETEIINRGEDLNSDVIMTGNMPEGIQKNELLTKPRKAISKSLATRTFKRIFEDTPFSK